MAKYRKKPIVVEAMQMPTANLISFVGEHNIDVHAGVAHLWVEANKAWLPLDSDEWVIKDSKGFYPCKADVFTDTYEPVA